jgi:alpha-L-rhamnosidase
MAVIAVDVVADWLHRTVGGLAPAAPGYRRFDIQPRPGGGLTYARARHRTPYGIAECAWAIEAGKITVKVVRHGASQLPADEPEGQIRIAVHG